MSKKLLLGAHMSIAGGVHNAIARGESIGCTAIQIFTKSNRQWHAAPLKAEEIQLFKEAVKNSKLIDKKDIVVHAAYLINIATADKEMRAKSIDGLAKELERCEQLDIPWLVLHPGARGEADEESSVSLIAQALDEVLEKAKGHTTILLETMAGQGSSMCSTFEQIAAVLKQVQHKSRVGVCIDTCHIFAAGYDIKDHYTAVMKKFEDVVGLDKLHAIHINDSKKGCGSRVDRHADVGEGEIGLALFKELFNDPRLAGIPKILETPETSDDVMKDYARNMAVIRKLVD